MEEDNRNNNSDLNEEQNNWYYSKNPTDPTPISSDETLIEAVEVECLKCSVKDIEKYNQPITRMQYLEDCINKICPTCENPYQLRAYPKSS